MKRIQQAIIKENNNVKQFTGMTFPAQLGHLKTGHCGKILLQCIHLAKFCDRTGPSSLRGQLVKCFTAL